MYLTSRLNTAISRVKHQTRFMANSSGILGDGTKAVKIHHLIKAPENTPESVSFRESWDASKPVTVYKTPENLPDGTPCTAVTVILSTK